MKERKKIEILGIPVDQADKRLAMEIFDELMEAGSCKLIVTPNSEIIMNATKDATLAELLKGADLLIPDGIGLVYASKILGQPLGERVTGIDFADNILKRLAEEGKSAFFFGSKPDAGDGSGLCVAELAARNKQQEYPGLKIAGTYHGYFKEEEEAEIVERINQSGADFLLVALGSPKQELFVRRHQKELKVKVAIGVGGSLDVWAGTLKRAPEFYQKHGLEWLYRLIQEPSRYKRMAVLPLFIIKVMATKGRKTNGN